MQPTEVIQCGLRFCVSVLTKQYVLNFINICLSKLALYDYSNRQTKNRVLCFIGGLQKLTKKLLRTRIKRPENQISRIMEETQGFKCSKQACVSADRRNVRTGTAASVV